VRVGKFAGDRNQPVWLQSRPWRLAEWLSCGSSARAALRRRRAEQREGELRGARGAECAVREVAVVEAGDGEHAQCEQRRRQAHRRRADPDPEHRQAREVQRDERNHAQPVDALCRGFPHRAGVGVKPLPELPEN
jgi:hypothetical protein